MEKFGSSINSVKGNEGNKCNYNSRLDTYGCGCQHDCSYCYAKYLLDFRKLWNPQKPRVTDRRELAKEIVKIPRNEVIRLGGMTDCLQPIERRYKRTLQTIKWLNELGREYLIVTKSAMIGEDEYINALDKNLAHIQVTITTLDDELALTYEKADVPSKRVKAVERLQDEGFDVAVRLSPFIPGNIDLDELAKVKCDKIIVEFLRVNHWIDKAFDVDTSEYIVKQGGYRHLPLAKKKELIKQVKGFKEVSVCEDQDAAYEYWKRNFNPNPDDCCNLRRK